MENNGSRVGRWGIGGGGGGGGGGAATGQPREDHTDLARWSSGEHCLKLGWLGGLECG